MKFFLLLITTTLLLSASNAFINVEDLKKEMTLHPVVLLDTTDIQTFKLGHIPVAQHVDLADFRHHEKKYQLINSSKKIQKIAKRLGINNNSRVVLYGHNKPKELLKASYIALAFIANGLENVSILNGGYDDWVFSFPGFISQETTKIKKGDFVAKFNPNILVDLEYVKAHIGKTPMIEARPLRYFNAQAQSSGVRRLGHIAQAKSSAWSNKFDNDHCIKSNKELEEIYLNKNGLNPKEEVITYCTGGLEASMNWFILYKHLHFTDVKIYDASMREWGNRDDTPMEK